LRQRLQPNWVPSWKGTTKNPYSCKDAHWGSRSSRFMDAKEITTGHLVAMKIIRQKENPFELVIGTLLTSGEMSSDPLNHCVPILRTLPIPDQDGHVMIVMPYLQQWYHPKFRTVGEGVQFVSEMLEGLQFIHQDHVAHHDGGFTNIMMDASQMYGPEGFHPHERDKKYDLSGRARPYSRTERPPKYYFIDFGLSDIYNPDDLPATICALEGGDKTVPEFLADDPDWTKRTPKHDPFAVDVYYLGNTFKAFFHLRGMKGFQFMEPLIAAMTESNPSKRITTNETVERFAFIEKGLSRMTLRSRVVYNTDFTIFRPFKAVSHWVWTLALIARGIPANARLSPQ
ncbi:hypothetical protein IW261DRAFT_1328703, partial [Armillaria novae-zelandiae]